MKETKPNIVFIVIDALRAKNLGCYGYHRNTTPNIDKLAKEGILFENCYTCSTSTDPSFTTIFSGKYPSSHGIMHHGPNVTDEEEERLYSSDTKMLAEVLRSNGYTTIGIDWLGRWHKAGFDYYWGEEEGKTIRESIVNKMVKKLPTPLHNFLFKIIRKRRLFLPDHEGGNFTRIAIEKIKDSNSPFFILIHYWDTHTPFRIPYEYFEKFDNLPKRVKIKDILKKIEDKKRRDFTHKAIIGPMYNYMEEFIAAYDAAVNYVDFQIGKIVEFLRSSGLEESTLLIITADHGELLGEHYPFFDHCGLSEEVIHVPLIVKYGDHLPSKKINSLVQHVDIMPTVLEFLGINLEKHKFDGHSLCPEIKKGLKIERKHAYTADARTGKTIDLVSK